MGLKLPTEDNLPRVKEAKYRAGNEHNRFPLKYPRALWLRVINTNVDVDDSQSRCIMLLSTFKYDVIEIPKSGANMELECHSTDIKKHLVRFSVLPAAASKTALFAAFLHHR